MKNSRTGKQFFKNFLLIFSQSKFTFLHLKLQYLNYIEIDKCDICCARKYVQYCHMCDIKLCELCLIEQYDKEKGVFCKFDHSGKMKYVCDYCSGI